MVFNRGSTFEVNLDVAVQVRLVAGSVLADAADVRLLPGVNLEVTVQQRFAEKVLAAGGPRAHIALLVRLLVVDAHVRFAVECDAAAQVGRAQPLVHRHDVALEVVPPVGDVGALGVGAVKRLVVLRPGVALRRGDVVQGVLDLREVVVGQVLEV